MNISDKIAKIQDIEGMKTKYYLVTRKNEVIAWVFAHNFEHAVEEMNNKVGTATRRSSDCIMSAAEYQPDRTSNNYTGIGSTHLLGDV